MPQHNKLNNPNLLTTTLPTGETVLCKKNLEPLMYGNQTAARKKIDSSREHLEAGQMLSVVKQSGRFLVLVWKENAEIDRVMVTTTAEQEHIFERSRGQVTARLYAIEGPGKPPFATVTGTRMNMRSRFNHPTNTSDKSYSYTT